MSVQPDECYISPMNSMFNEHTVFTVFNSFEKASHDIPVKKQSVILSVVDWEKACFSPRKKTTAVTEMIAVY